ncbi:MAG: hypothetical protein WCI61_01475, partial [Chloroflexota bacterium]
SRRSAAMTALAIALRDEQYEVAALRLLLGLLVAMHETAPAAREELLALLTPHPHDGEASR